MATTIRQQIIASLFRPGSPNGELIIHLKVQEQIPGAPQNAEQSKARYMLLGVNDDGRVRLHKSKRNSNGSFSIGKTWDLTELQALEVVEDKQGFAITLNGKSYFWETDAPAEQVNFLVTLVRSFRVYTANKRSLKVYGFQVNERPNHPPPYLVPSSNRDAVPLQSTATSQTPAPNMSSMPSNTSTVSSAPLNLNARRPAQSRVSEYDHLPPPIQMPPSPIQRPRPNTGNSQTSDRNPPLRPSLTSMRSQPSNYSTSSANQNPQIPSVSSRIENGHLSPPMMTSPTFPSSTGQFDSRQGSPSVIRDRRAPSPTQSVSSSRPSQSPSIPGPTPFKSHKRGESSIISSPLRPSPITSNNTPPLKSGMNGSVIPSSEIRSRSPAPDIISAITEQPTRPQTRMNGSNSPNEPSVNREDRPPLASTGREDVAPPKASLAKPKPKRINTATDSTRNNPFEAVDNDTLLANVEEMLEGFEWKTVASLKSISAGTGSSNEKTFLTTGTEKGQIEKNLNSELTALESASVHAIVESDDRVNYVIKYLDESMAELDKLDQLISLYKMQLNVMNDDIAHIESQNKGLQVETSNQRALLAELDNMLDTFNIPENDLEALMQTSLETQSGIDRVQEAVVSLYKAILSTRDKTVGDMTAASERVAEYNRYSSQFCKRVYEALAVMFRQQADLIIQKRESSGGRLISVLKPHDEAEKYLERYCGLTLFIKEIDDQRYQQICAAYFATMSDLYKHEVQGHLTFVKTLIRKPTEEELDGNFTLPAKPVGFRRKASAKPPVDQLQGGDALNRAFKQIGPHILREQVFITDLLHVTGADSYITFAAFMSMETFFQRGAASHMSSIMGRFKDLKSSIDLLFGFLPDLLADMVNFILQRDPMQVIGVLAAIDQAVRDNKAVQNDFFVRALQRQGVKCVSELDKMIKEQTKAIEQTKLTVKKRRGVVPFVSVFPLFVERLESQLANASDLPIRQVVNTKYDTIASTMFESLQQMAKMDGENTLNAEDKDQLNYHVVLIENMNHLLTVFRNLQVSALETFMQRARDVYDENLSLYIRMVLRRPLGRLFDFFQGLEQLLRNTPPNEVSLHSAYTKSAAKKAAGSLNGKDLRKAVETLSKRVEKHFTDIENPSAENAAVLNTVWQACQDEAMKLTGTWQSLLNRCYADSGVSLFALEEVEAAFQRNKPGALGRG